MQRGIEERVEGVIGRSNENIQPKAFFSYGNTWKYWVGQKFHSGLSTRCYGKTKKTPFLTNPIKCSLLFSYCGAQLFQTLWTLAHQAPLSIGFLRQEYWSGLSFLLPGALPGPEIETLSHLLAGGFLTTE